MKISRLLLLGALSAALVAPAHLPFAQAAPAPTYTSKKDGYAIFLPGKPTAASRPMPVPGLGQANINFISLQRPPLAFVVIPIKLPGTPTGANIQQFLTGVERGFTMSTGSKLLSSKPLKLNGVPGKEILVQAGQNLIRGRFFVKGNRSFQVVAVAPKAGEGKYHGQIMQFLDSFRILG